MSPGYSRRAHLVPLALALAAVFLWADWGLVALAAAWLVAIGVLALVDVLVIDRLGRVPRVAAPLAALPLLYLLTFEGGLFLVPSAVALVVVHALDRQERVAAPTG